jgi:hypothetical protein
LHSKKECLGSERGQSAASSGFIKLPAWQKILLHWILIEIKRRWNTAWGCNQPSPCLAGYLLLKFNRSQFLLITTPLYDIGKHLSHRQPCVDVGLFSDQEARDLSRAKLRALDGSSTPAVNTPVVPTGRTKSLAW